MLAKKPTPHLLCECFYHRVSLDPLQDLLWKSRSQEIARQEKPQKKHSLAAQSSGLLYELLPIYLLVVTVNQLGNVADPTQPFPEMVATVYAEDEQQILLREGQDRPTAKGDLFKTPPQFLGIEP